MRSSRGGYIFRLPPCALLLAFGCRIDEMAAGKLSVARVVELRRDLAAVAPGEIATVGEAASHEFPGEPGHAAADHVERRAALAARGQRVEQLSRVGVGGAREERVARGGL